MAAWRTAPILAILIAAAVHPAAAATPTTMACGSLSPFGNTCSDCCLAAPSYVSIRADLLSFVGEVRITLQQDRGAVSVTCWSVAAPALPDTSLTSGQPFLGGCRDPVTTGRGLERGVSTSLSCAATATREPLNNPGAPGLGPWGTWGCNVLFSGT